MFFGKSSFLLFVLTCISLLALVTPANGQNDNRVPFRHRIGYPAPENNIFHIRGDFTIIGNTNLTLTTYRENVQNALEEMSFVDIDNDPETFNSSAATLMFSEENGADPNCSEILYAGLYWSGRTELGKGLTFDTKTGGKPGAPVTLDKKEEEISPLEEIDYFPYTFNVFYSSDENGLYFPIYELISPDGSESLTFQFTNDGEVIYGFNYHGEFMPVEDLKIVTSDGKSTATFKPITFSFEDLTFSIGELTRSPVTSYDGLIEKDIYFKLITSGTYTPYIYQTAHFDKRRVKLKAPGATEYIEVTAAGNAILFPQGELGEMYVGYADVTQLVRDHGSGEYTVADIALTEGSSDNIGSYGHWGLIVVYQNAKMNFRDVTIFDGYTFVEAKNGAETVGEIEINGFGTVKEGPVSLKLGILAGEGDQPTSGDFLEILDQKGDWIRLQHPNNTPNNFFNSSIYTPVRMADESLKENPRNPFLNNNTGIDIVQWDIPNPENSIIANNQTSARFKYGTNQDLYTLYSLAFSVLSYSPEIQAHNQIISIDGKIPTDSPSARPGEEIAYQVDIRNAGSETSEQTRIVIPIPYTASFVNAEVIPGNYGSVTFDPNQGLSGAIIWELGTVPLTENPEELIASLQYTLKLTEDCFVLANDNCDARVSVNGSISGIGGTSKQTYSDTPFIKGFMDGDCSGYGIYGPLEVPITGKAEFAATHCLGFELVTNLNSIDLPEFCLGDTPANLSEHILPSKEGYQIFFFSDEIGGTPLLDYYVNTSFAGTETVWVSEGPFGSCTGIRVPVDLIVRARSPQPITEDIIMCMEQKSIQFSVDESPGFSVLYYADNDPLTLPLATAPLIDLSAAKDLSIWVSQFKEGECESFRKEVKFLVEDCSLRPNIQLFLTADPGRYSQEQELITFILVVKNTGGIRLDNVVVNEYLTYRNWNITNLNPSEEQTFSFSYNATLWDLQSGSITLNANANGFDRYGEFVYDDQLLEIQGVEYEITTSPVVCQSDGIALGSISVYWQHEQSGTYTIRSLHDSKEYSGEFESKNRIQHQVPAGDYTLDIWDSAGQPYSVTRTISIEKRDEVEFWIPTQVDGCGEYLLAPETAQELAFTLIAPDGSIINQNSDGYFPIVQKGSYKIKGTDPQQVLCPVEKTFQSDILLPAALELEAMPFCSEDTSTTIFLKADAAEHEIKWFSVNSEGDEHLDAYDNSTMLIVQGEGAYRVTLTDKDGCALGVGEIQITQSFTQPPTLNSLYTICPKKNALAAIEPGSRFTEYSWILDGVEVSVSPVFIPTLVGSYSLIAKDWLGCDFFADFEVEIKCEPEVLHPTAIRPGDPERAFVVYPDNLTDELELSIYNRWGQLIYYCEDKNLENEVKSSCVWDGTFNNTAAPNGSYLVLVRIKNRQQNLTIVQRSSVLVFD
ncbi:hypothetical protein J2X69_001791 [Algoriphagus sp. 4150]|uniref:DUF7507 domain-containing protein n=1 Tax=Algoriphagus sp. 4150 TaxID=2817756 RepID=UPI0028566F91|nr:gliding motility-associated C-terminal domain-containing protein [Algoriphagus sp. 4150]MDR7129454.1 hypothetical protein [Algoriphagus sp. 4150]